MAGLTTDITGPTAAGCWVRAREAGGVDGMVRRHAVLIGICNRFTLENLKTKILELFQQIKVCAGLEVVNAYCVLFRRSQDHFGVC